MLQNLYFLSSESSFLSVQQVLSYRSTQNAYSSKRKFNLGGKTFSLTLSHPYSLLMMIFLAFFIKSFYSMSVRVNVFTYQLMCRVYNVYIYLFILAFFVPLFIFFFFSFLLIENLQYLRLGDNDLHMIPSDSLRPLHRLRHLDLRSNNISYIPEDAFVGYGDSITFLNLQKNEWVNF